MGEASMLWAHRREFMTSYSFDGAPAATTTLHIEVHVNWDIPACDALIWNCLAQLLFQSIE